MNHRGTEGTERRARSARPTWKHSEMRLALRFFWVMLFVIAVLTLVLECLSQERPRLTVSLSAAQAGDRYTEYFYPIVTNRYVTNQFTGGVVTNVVTNFNGGWSAPAYRIALGWNGRAGSNYVVESSVSLETRPYPPGTTNMGWSGDGWTPCSMPMMGRSGVMNWASGVPDRMRFFRVTTY